MVRSVDNDNMNLDRSSEFTPDRATKTLPLVRRIVADMVRLQSEINRQREQLKDIDALDSTMKRESYSDELNDVRESLQTDEAALESCFRELSELGVVPHSPFDGCVDFPAVIHRRPALLCWNLEDDIVCHWHEVDRCDDRREIDPQWFAAAEAMN